MVSEAWFVPIIVFWITHLLLSCSSVRGLWLSCVNFNKAVVFALISVWHFGLFLFNTHCCNSVLSTFSWVWCQPILSMLSYNSVVSTLAFSTKLQCASYIKASIISVTLSISCRRPKCNEFKHKRPVSSSKG